MNSAFTHSDYDKVALRPSEDKEAYLWPTPSPDATNSFSNQVDHDAKPTCRVQEFAGTIDSCARARIIAAQLMYIVFNGQLRNGRTVWACCFGSCRFSTLDDKTLVHHMMICEMANKDEVYCNGCDRHDCLTSRRVRKMEKAMQKLRSKTSSAISKLSPSSTPYPERSTRQAISPNPSSGPTSSSQSASSQYSWNEWSSQPPRGMPPIRCVPQAYGNEILSNYAFMADQSAMDPSSSTMAPADSAGNDPIFLDDSQRLTSSPVLDVSMGANAHAAFNSEITYENQRSLQQTMRMPIQISTNVSPIGSQDGVLRNESIIQSSMDSYVSLPTNEPPSQSNPFSSAAIAPPTTEPMMLRSGAIRLPVRPERREVNSQFRFDAAFPVNGAASAPDQTDQGDVDMTADETSDSSEGFAKSNATDIFDCTSKDGNYKCPECSYCPGQDTIEKNRGVYLKRHCMTHVNGGENIVCECGTTFTRRDNYRTHQVKYCPRSVTQSRHQAGRRGRG